MIAPCLGSASLLVCKLPRQQRNQKICNHFCTKRFHLHRFERWEQVFEDRAREKREDELRDRERKRSLKNGNGPVSWVNFFELVVRFVCVWWGRKHHVQKITLKLVNHASCPLGSTYAQFFGRDNLLVKYLTFCCNNAQVFFLLSLYAYVHVYVGMLITGCGGLLSPFLS